MTKSYYPLVIVGVNQLVYHVNATAINLNNPRIIFKQNISSEFQMVIETLINSDVLALDSDGIWQHLHILYFFTFLSLSFNFPDPCSYNIISSSKCEECVQKFVSFCYRLYTYNVESINIFTSLSLSFNFIFLLHFTAHSSCYFLHP